MRAFILVIVTLLPTTSTASIVYHRIFRQPCKLALVQNRGCQHTRRQIQIATKAKLVFPAGYFWPIKKTARQTPQLVDFGLSNKKPLADYLTLRRRPILATNRFTGKVAIFHSFATFQQYRRSFTDAAAGDSQGQQPKRSCLRTIVGLDTYKRVHAFIMIGTVAECRARMKKLKVSTYLFFDSGSSCLPGTKMPSYWIVS